MSAETTDKPLFEQRERPTIMDGRVVTYATHFEESKGVFGTDHRALGAFEVSASRNAVVVHRAEVRNAENLNALLAALDQAWHEHRRMK